MSVDKSTADGGRVGLGVPVCPAPMGPMTRFPDGNSAPANCYSGCSYSRDYRNDIQIFHRSSSRYVRGFGLGGATPCPSPWTADTGFGVGTVYATVGQRVAVFVENMTVKKNLAAAAAAAAGDNIAWARPCLLCSSVVTSEGEPSYHHAVSAVYLWTVKALGSIETVPCCQA